jgi:acylphosphatase
MRARRLLISGIVQGVGFRYFTRRAARALGIIGWVRNLRDGRVEAVASGPEEALRDFTEQLRTGPGGAKVNGVAIDETDLEPDLSTFEIRP